jgi:hypothetical protein
MDSRNIYIDCTAMMRKSGGQKTVSGAIFNSESKKDLHVEFMDGEGRPALFTRVRDETAEMPSETGARSRKGGRHT